MFYYQITISASEKLEKNELLDQLDTIIKDFSCDCGNCNNNCNNNSDFFIKWVRSGRCVISSIPVDDIVILIRKLITYNIIDSIDNILNVTEYQDITNFNIKKFKKTILPDLQGEEDRGIVDRYA